MRRCATFVIVAVASVALVGCASYSITPFSDPATVKDGYMVYQPEPYLLGAPTVDKEGKVTGYGYQLVWLPNYHRGYSITTKNILAKADFTFTFTNGWQLASVAAKTENTAVMEKTIDALKEMLPKLAAMSAQEAPKLFRIVFSSKTGQVLGLKEVPTKDFTE